MIRYRFNLILFVVFTSIIPLFAEEFYYKKYKWNTDKDTILKNEKEFKSQDDNDNWSPINFYSKIIKDQVLLFGYDFKLLLEFFDGYFVEERYTYKILNNEKTSHIDVYLSIRKKLIKKMGLPSCNYPIEKQDFYLRDKNKAAKYIAANIQWFSCKWQTDTESFELYLSGLKGVMNLKFSILSKMKKKFSEKTNKFFQEREDEYRKRINWEHKDISKFVLNEDILSLKPENLQKKLPKMKKNHSSDNQELCQNVLSDENILFHNCFAYKNDKLIYYYYYHPNVIRLDEIVKRFDKIYGESETYAYWLDDYFKEDDEMFWDAFEAGHLYYIKQWKLENSKFLTIYSYYLDKNNSAMLIVLGSFDYQQLIPKLNKRYTEDWAKKWKVEHRRIRFSFRK